MRLRCDFTVHNNRLWWTGLLGVEGGHGGHGIVVPWFKV